MTSRRTERVASLIREIIAEAIQNRLSDPRIPSITSITRVDVSEDLSLARVNVSVMASDTQRRLCLDALRSASGLLRRLMAPQLRMRKVPTLSFDLDDSLRRGFETVTAIDRAMRELGEGPERDWERRDQADQDSDDETGSAGAAPRRSALDPQEDA